MPQDTDIVVSQLPSASAVNASDLVMLTQVNAQAETGYDTKKGTFENVANKVVHGIEYETLLSDFPQSERNPTDALNYLRDFIIGQLPIVEVSGSIASFTTPLALPLVSLKANITATQSGTGTPSPSNPRPISGFSSVTLTQKDSEDTTVDTFTISLGETIYGGVLDVKNGTAKITHAYEDLGDLTWGLGTGGVTRFVAAPTYTAKVPSAATIQADVISDIFKPVSSRTIYDGLDDYEIAIHTNGTIWVRDTDYNDRDTFKTAMANHYIVYELATPITLSGLTPDNFTTIAGENNIFADSGNVELSFKQGIQEYIDEQIATTQALIL